jgi:hypothetical protein
VITEGCRFGEGRGIGYAFREKIPVEKDRYQNVIIGNGEGGKYLAWHLAESGQPTVAWAPIRRYWTAPTSEDREAIRQALNLAGMRREYASGNADTDVIAPESTLFPRARKLSGATFQMRASDFWIWDTSHWKRTWMRSRAQCGSSLGRFG